MVYLTGNIATSHSFRQRQITHVLILTDGITRPYLSVIYCCTMYQWSVGDNDYLSILSMRAKLAIIAASAVWAGVIRFGDITVNSLRPGNANMPHWIGSSLVHVMSCCIFGAKPLPDQWWLIVNWARREKFSDFCYRNWKKNNPC